MFTCTRRSSEDVKVVKKKNPIIDSLSVSLLRRWDFFRQMRDEDLLEIKSFHVFHTPSHMSCRGGLAAIFINVHDEVYGLGHNCNNVNILGFSRDTRGYRKDLLTTPHLVGELSYKAIKDLSVGGLVGAAIAGCGTLFLWGLCYQRYGEIMTPHIPSCGRRKYVKVTCGHRMVAALSESKKVYVWGQVVNNSSRYLNGELLVVNAVISDIACGLHHVAMLDKDGRLFTWGRGNEGQRSLDDYSFSDQYQVKKVRVDPCIKIKCGPYSTLCITRLRELRACGSNCNLHLGTDDRSKLVKTLSRISIGEAITDVVVLWGCNNSARMAATTADGEIYTWGNSRIPSNSEHRSFFDVFTAWDVTPGLTSVTFPSPTSGWTVSNIITPRELRSINVTDVLNHVYLRDRPELAVHAVRHSSRVSTRDIAYLSSKITCEESGKNFILEKFFKDVYMHKQEVPVEYHCENAIDCLAFSRLCPSGSCHPM